MTSTLKTRKSTTLRYSLLGMAIFVLASGTDQKNWKEITTVEDVCESYVKQIKNMLQQFNLEYEGLEKVKKANDQGNIVEACTYLLAYYKNGTSSARLRIGRPVKTDKTVPKADTILNDVFIVQNVRGKVPYEFDGHCDWYYKGPINDREWAWLSNRHSQINYLFDTYLETGNPKYANYIDAFLRDFIIKSMFYPDVKSSTSVWRGLEVAARVKVWTRLFLRAIER